jgi:hypothetical protein
MCDRCASERVAYVCDHCDAYQFCSLECADALALEHAAKCYDCASEDREYLARLAGPLLAAVGDRWTVDEAHALLGEHLKHSTFDADTILFIAARGIGGRRRRNKNKRKKKKRGRRQSNKPTAGRGKMKKSTRSAR